MRCNRIERIKSRPPAGTNEFVPIAKCLPATKCGRAGGATLFFLPRLMDASDCNDRRREFCIAWIDVEISRAWHPRGYLPAPVIEFRDRLTIRTMLNVRNKVESGTASR